MMPENKAHDMAATAEKATAAAAAAAETLCQCSLRAGYQGKLVLKGAHVHVYAAMIADIVRYAEGQIGPFVQMDETTVKPTRELLAEQIFKKFGRSWINDGALGSEFLLEVKRKADRIMQARTAA